MLSMLLATGGVARAEDGGFTTLFDGKDLSNFTAAPGSRWIVADGLIALDDRSDGQEHNYEYLWTKETYGNFVLDLEFKIPERANSGVFLRTPDMKDPVQTGLEIQVCNSFGKTEWSKGNCAGAIYDCLAPSENAVKPPGQWNRCVITCNRNKITVVLNGRQVIDMDLDLWKQTGKNPDGTENKFSKAVKDFAREGHVGLQDHGLPVWYRNVKIKRL